MRGSRWGGGTGLFEDSDGETVEPHLEQNFAPSLSSAPQFSHLCTSDEPHSEQNLSSGVFSCRQLAHLMRPVYSNCGSLFRFWPTRASRREIAQRLKSSADRGIVPIGLQPAAIDPIQKLDGASSAGSSLFVVTADGRRMSAEVVPSACHLTRRFS